MSLEELITEIHKKINAEEGNHITKAEIRKVYNTLIDIFKERLETESEDLHMNKKEVKIYLPLLGKFKVVRQDSYMGKNPKTKEKIKIKANNRIYFSPYKAIKESANK